MLHVGHSLSLLKAEWLFCVDMRNRFDLLLDTIWNFLIIINITYYCLLLLNFT